MTTYPPEPEGAEAACEPSASLASGESPDAEMAADDTAGREDDGSPQPAVQGVSTRRRVGSVLVFTLLPILVASLGGLAGFLKWEDAEAGASDIARIESVGIARDATVAMLTYRPDSAEEDLKAAEGKMTGRFRDDYAKLVNDLVIPGAIQKQITSLATATAAASISAESNRAVVMVYVNQNVTVGNDAPTDTASTVKVTLDKEGDRWLISAFDPI